MKEGLPGASKNELKDAPAFVKEYSRATHSEERKELAQEIRAKRTERFEAKREVSVLAEVLEQQQKQLDEYNSASYLTKVIDHLRMLRVKSALGLTQERKAEADKAVSAQNPNEAGKEAIAALYEREKKAWASAEYTKEDMAKYFTEEHLAALSLEDYALLMKRFPSHMVTHVTRQGVRDHSGMPEHSADKDVMHNGFNKLLEDGRLKSPLAVRLIEAQKERSLTKVLERPGFNGIVVPESREEALEALALHLGDYADKRAIHFAAEAVADTYYGSEKGNEIFIAYPSAYIASQYEFNAPLTGNKDIKHNDVYVWDREERGMNLNAGLVFIPKEARVDPNTGSRYALDAEKRPVPNESIPDIEAWMTEPGFTATAERIIELHTERGSSDVPPIDAWDSLASLSHKSKGEQAAEQLIPLREELRSKGILNSRMQEALLSYDGAFWLRSGLRKKEQQADSRAVHEAIDMVLGWSGLRFAEAKDTVLSQEYWESHFAANPDARPSKIVYYKGDSPTQALRQWQSEQGITKGSADENLGFAEHRISEDSSEAGIGKGRYESLLRQAIDDVFPAREPVMVD